MRHGHIWIGEPKNAPVLLLCEGFATACSLHQATGYPVCVCFSAGNLKPVAEMVRKSAFTSSARLLICGDDDTQTEVNPGRTKATEAAQAVAAGVVFPVSGGDFNDMAQDEGLEEVQAHIEQALEESKVVPVEFSIPVIIWHGCQRRNAQHAPIIRAW